MTDLPPDLADGAAERLLAVHGPDRDRELRELVAAHPQHAAALQRLGHELAGAEAMLDVTFAAVRRDAPTEIGGHRVVQTLGEGAFGVVYLCAQERPVVRDVAIKVLRPGAGDERTLRRFAGERQVLATLNHPAITQVFDAGELPDGRPFFVMEYVAGPTIRAYCDERALPCAERLRLFVQLCRGVAHAHARGIVHRDLKPANVLVVAGDDGPQPKIIDFGIAKALFATASEDRSRTDPGRVIGTPGYMSPEQAAGRTDAIDARADVFALGVMLFELLTGELPWTDGAAATDAEPPRPSQRVTTTTQSLPPALVTQRRQLAAALRGDLDWITLKALARERDERYATVHELIGDVERHLRGETVSVGPPSLRYRLRKFVRRRRAVVTAAAVGSVLATGLLFALLHAANKDSEAAAARDVAHASISDARGIVARLLQRADDPSLYGTAEGDAVRKALSAEALHFVEHLLSGDPTDPRLQADRCDALQSVAQVHWLLGEPTLARAAASEAVRIAANLIAAAPDDLDHRSLLGRALRQEGRAIALAGAHAEALPKFTAAIEHLAACAAASPKSHGAIHAAALHEAASVVPDADPDAVDACRRALAAYAAIADDGRDEVREGRLATRLSLVDRLVFARRYDEAKRELDLVAGQIDSLPKTWRRMAVDFYGLRGRLAWIKGGRKETLPDFEAAVAAAAEWCEAQPRRNMAHRLLASQLAQLGRMQGWVGDFAASSASYRRSITAAEALAQQFPDDATAPGFLIKSLADYAFLLRERFRREDLAEAAAMVTRALEVDGQLPPGAAARENTPRWVLLATQAGIAESLGEPGAEAQWRAVAAMLPAASPGWGDAQIETFLDVVTSVARCHCRAGEFELAAQRIATARALIEQRDDHRKRLVEVGWIEARIAGARGDHAAIDSAAAGILAARPTWYGRRRAADCMHLAWRTVRTQPGVGAEVVASYRDRAVEWYDMVVRTLQEDIDQTPDDPWFVLPWGFSLVRLAELYAADGDVSHARALLGKALPRLEAVRGNAQMDQWDDEAFADGNALRDRLAN